MSDKVVLVIIDGLGFETAIANCGYLESLVAGSKARRWRMRTALPTLSVPLYETLHCGLEPHVHGITSNDHGESSSSDNVFAVVRRHNRRTGAVQAYVGAVRTAPDSTGPYLKLAHAFITKSKLDLAVSTYRTAIDLDPTIVEAHVGLADALARQARHDEAIAAMHDALTLDPGHGPAHERLAVWYYFADDDARAWTHVKAARAAGTPVPPQLEQMLAERTPEPGS